MMINKIQLTACAFFLAFSGLAQEVEFTEYKLDNGLHVILHQDNSAPVVTTSVMYHVGAKNEDPERTGFAHFFEHLLFEGTENIGKGEWFKMVSSNGGSNNANTTDDRTYYYEIFPSNNLELGLWMESERMMHPIIDQKGVDTQNEVVKEEKRLRVDNAPYGNILAEVKKNLYEKHPYRWATIGSMEHLDAATLEEFRAFNDKYYVPNNATLVVAGDIDIEETRKMISDYFGPIEKGEPLFHRRRSVGKNDSRNLNIRVIVRGFHLLGNRFFANIDPFNRLTFFNRTKIVADHFLRFLHIDVSRDYQRGIIGHVIFIIEGPEFFQCGGIQMLH